MAIVPNLGIPGGVDLKYASANRRAATNAAVMALTPLYCGELVLTADNGFLFRGQTITVGDWLQVYADK